ncbi:MAG: hypothetical protein ABI520_15275 [Caldimonas sp.]
MSLHRLWVSAALASVIAWTAPFAAARETVVAVENVDVEQVGDLGAGVPLNFTVFGTPGALVTVRIEGARRILELREGEPGVYEGSYVIDARDAIRPDSRATASLQRQGAIAYSTLDEPLLLAKGSVPWGAAVATPAPSSSPPMAMAAAPTPVPMATPTVPTAMPIPVTVTPPRPVPPAAYAAAPARDTPGGRAPCSDCAVVESVRAVEAPPRGGVVGAIGGAIAGAVLGKELGAAHTRRVLTVLGAIGGALAGRQIELQATQATHYDVELRLADGTVLKRRYEQAPPFAAGATIQLGAGRGTPVPASF